MVVAGAGVQRDEPGRVGHLDVQHGESLLHLSLISRPGNAWHCWLQENNSLEHAALTLPEFFGEIKAKPLCIWYLHLESMQDAYQGLSSELFWVMSLYDRGIWGNLGGNLGGKCPLGILIRELYICVALYSETLIEWWTKSGGIWLQ